jgi:hypothetical protein
MRPPSVRTAPEKVGRERDTRKTRMPARPDWRRVDVNPLSLWERVRVRVVPEVVHAARE